MESAPLDVGIVGWHSHNEMFDAIGADLRKAGHRIIRYAHREAFTATPDPLAGIDVLLCVGVLPLTRAMLAAASRLRAIVSAVTGVDGVDIAAATERTVVIANAQTEENIIGMAEATVLLMLAALYDLDGAQDRVRQRPVASAAAQGEPAPRQDHRPGRARQDRARNRAPAGAVGRDPAVQRAPRRRPQPVCRRCSASISTRCCARATSSWCWRASTRRRAGYRRREAQADEADRDPGQHRARRHRR